MGFRRVVLMVLLVYAGLVGLLYFGQERLLFLPEMGGRELISSPADRGLHYETVWLETEDGERLHAWWVPHPQPLAVLHFSHGNAGNLSHRLDSVEMFHDLGLSVLLYDYRGYGRSSGRPDEAGIEIDALTAWSWLIDQAGVAPAQVVLFGRSLGGAVAARLAAELAPAAQPGALILESTFTSVPDLAAELYWWLPARRLARIQLDARAALAVADQPTLIVHSRDDEIVPFAHAGRLLEAAPGRAKLLVIEGSHNTGFLRSRQAYRAGLADFLAAVFSSDHHSRVDKMERFPNKLIEFRRDHHD